MSTSAMTTLEIGHRINDRFRVLSVLGAGGFGCVYKVADEERGDDHVALKTIRLETAGDHAVDLFQREFAELTKFQHPNIATAFEYGRVGQSGQHFFTAEYIDGVDLTQGTREKSVDEKMVVLAEVCRALEFVHNRGLIHHDLKPGNILMAVPTAADAELGGVEGLGHLELQLGAGRRVIKLIDFGLIESEDFASETVLGTPPYMSPERIQGRETDRRSDLYSLGIIMYRLLTGTSPFKARGKEWFEAHVKRAPILPEQYGIEVPPALTQITMRLLEKDPANRYGSAAEVVEALSMATGQDLALDTKETSGQYLVSGPLVGRDLEVEALRSTFNRVSGGSEVTARSMIVSGNPGYGVTRLLEDLRYHAQRSGAVVLRIDARSGPTLSEFIQQMGRELRITGQSLAVDATTAGTMPVAAVRVAIEEALFDLAAHSAVVLLLDHVQSADEVVLELCRELVASLTVDKSEAAPQIVLVLGNSGGSVPSSMPTVGLQRIDLDAFDEATVRQLLEESFGVANVPTDFARKLCRASDGNPLYVVETVKHLAREGEIRRSGGKWVLPKRPELIELPESLTSLASSKLLELPERVIAILEWIATFGQPIPVEVLQRLTAMESDTLVGLVWAQVKSTLLTRVAHVAASGKVESRYRFAHDSLRHAMLDSIESERRVRMHASIASTIDTEHGEHSVEELAFHWLAAGDSARFLEFGFQAADSFHQRGELAKARTTYRDCLQAVAPTDLKRRFQAMAKISELDEAAGSPGDAADGAEQLLESAERFLKSRDKNRLRRRIALLRAKDGDVEAARSWLAQVESDDSDLEALSILAAQLFIDEVVANEPPSVEAWRTCRTVLSRITDPSDPSEATSARLLSSTLDLLGKCAHRSGDHPFGLAAFDRSHRLCNLVQSTQGAAASAANGGWLHIEIGQYDQASKLLEEAVESARRVGDRPTLARALVGLAETALARGSVESALKVATEALRTARIGGDDTSISRALQALGSIQSSVGHGDAARENMESALALETEGSFDAAIAASRLGALYVREAATDKALDLLNRAKMWGAKLNSPRVLCLCSLAESRLYLNQDDHEKARTAIVRCVDLADRHQFPRELSEVLLMKATIELCAGDRAAARQSIVRAGNTADSIAAVDLLNTATALLSKIDGADKSAAARVDAVLDVDVTAEPTECGDDTEAPNTELSATEPSATEQSVTEQPNTEPPPSITAQDTIA